MNPHKHKSGSYSVKAGGPVSIEGEGIDSLNLLLQGKLDVHISSDSETSTGTINIEELKQNSYRLFGAEQNIFIGANDLFIDGINSMTFTAVSDCKFFSCPASSWQDVVETIQDQKDYGAYIVNSICSLISNSYDALLDALSYYTSTDNMYKNLCIYYAAITSEYELSQAPGKVTDLGITGLSELTGKEVMVPVQFSRQFVEKNESDSADPFANDQINEDIEYYTHLSKIPSDIKKAYFSADSQIASRHIKEASICHNCILRELRLVFRNLEETLQKLYGEDDTKVYNAFINAAFEMREKGLDYAPALDAASYIYNKLKEMALFLKFKYKHDLGIDFVYYEHIHTDHAAALTVPIDPDGNGLSIPSSTVQSLPEELTGSASKILEYSGLPEDKVTCFMMNMTAFRNLKDRLSSDETARNIRKSIADSYFEIYEAVFMKAYKSKNDSRLIKMFLSFGYMDERLLDNDQIMALYKLAGIENTSGMPNVYFMHEWLTNIYDMNKNPSVNNFGHDYIDTFRELKKKGKLTDDDKQTYINDKEGRLTFEIGNMLRSNHKLCQGQISVYFPILHKDMAPHDPSRSFVSPSIVREKLSKILESDYSLFHREIHYRDPERKIEKEIIMAQVMPDILLVPVYGTRAMMWQEISGRLRNSPGRFIMPVLTDEDLDGMLIRLSGNFRWDLCRTMMGASWNNIAYSSLTSEYADYIQFYRKNRDLTEDAKEKVKALISRHHNKLRDIFTSEYEIWMKNESKGNPRLNRVARSIFMKYCPFSRDMREHLERQPIYTDLILHFKSQQTKKARELESRYKRYIKTHGLLDPVLKKNLEFYENM